MKRLLLLAGMLAAGATAYPQEAVPAFPGAEGHGRYVTGGRGGKVIHVTTLEDDKNGEIEGSLRWAMKQEGPKTIVFDVSGYIDLKAQLNVTSNTTIAGQTAPEGGITLRYYTLYFGSCDNVIVRFIRSRRSQVKDVNDGADATWGRNRHDIILDHCSFSWSIDEVASFYDNRNFTMQWCTLAEGLANPGHTKGEHSYGGIWGGKDASFHHNMIAHVQNRAPRFNGARYHKDVYDKTKYENTVDAERVDFRNCLIYNWGKGNGCYGGPGGGYINMVNNYYKAGPGTKNKKRVTTVTVSSSGNSDKKHPEHYGYTSRYYINGNYVAAASSPENYDWQGVDYDSGVVTIDGEKYMKAESHLFGENAPYVKDGNGKDVLRIRLDEPIGAGTVTTHSAQQAFDNILAHCGASLYRDAVDARYMEEARTGTVTFLGDTPLNGKQSNTKGIIDFINNPDGEQNPKTASYPELASNVRPDGYDSDGDGMPDAWETANGLDPQEAADGNAKTVDPRGIYTNLEVFLSSLVENVMKGGNSNALESVDEYYPACKTAAVDMIEEAPGETVAIEYYDLNGTRLPYPAEGISIRRTLYSNGKTVTDKVLKLNK